MRQLNILLEQQQSSMSKLLDQLNKTPIIQPTLERPSKIDPFRLELNEEPSEVEAEMLPSWFVKSPEDFDVLIAQRNLKEAVELAQKVKDNFEQYPKCCDNNHQDLKLKIDTRLQELVNAICSELQPSTDRSVQGGPRSSIASIKLLRELNLTSKAVKLYLDQRSSILRFVLSQQKIDSTTTLQFIKSLCSIFFHNTKLTCTEFKEAFEVDKHVKKAVEECVELGISDRHQNSDQMLLFDLVRSIYRSRHPELDENGSPLGAINGNHDISSHILSHHAERIVENSLMPRKCKTSDAFYNLSAYSSLTYWTVLEFENFISLFKEHVFNNSQLSISMIAESIHILRSECSQMASFCGIDMSQFIEKKLENELKQVVDDSKRKLFETIRKLDSEEQWQPQQFQNKAQLTRFFEEMNDVDLKTMPSYIFEELKLRFTACKTSFARYFLITVSDLAKVSRVWL